MRVYDSIPAISPRAADFEYIPSKNLLYATWTVGNDFCLYLNFHCEKLYKCDLYIKCHGLSTEIFYYIIMYLVLSYICFADTVGIQPKWFDWSVGVVNQTVGTGLLDINAQPVWYESGSATEALFSVATSKITSMLSK